MSSPPPVPARGRRPQVELAEAPSSELPLVSPVAEETLERTWGVRLWEYVNGEEGASVLLSLVLHIIMLVALAIPVYHTLKNEEMFTTVVQRSSDDDVRIDQPMNTEVALAMPETSGGDVLRTVPDQINPISPTLLPNINPSDLPSIPGDNQGKTGGEALGGGGIRIAEPRNAVRAGNFSVWPWPIMGADVRGRVVHGEPGSFPTVLQPYHIVIRLKVPEGKKSVNLSDFSGEVVGSDKYSQKIPHDAWFFNSKGDLVRARTGRAIPVIEGTAELLIRVPGAGNVAIRDSITVSSRLTDEEQKIELEFQDRRSMR